MARIALVFVWVAISLASIAEPPLGRDGWRESDGLMVGRNFCREDARLWLPRIDARGDGSGITGMELPILPYVYGLARCAGMNEVVVARLLTIVFTLLAAWALWSLATRVLDASGALLALGLFLFSPLIVHYGHAVQPDVPAVALALSGLACLERGLARFGLASAATRWRIGAALGLGLGMLVKLPVIVFGLPAAVMLVTSRGWRALLQPRWLFLGGATLLPTIAWYGYARSLQTRYGYAHFRLGTSFSELTAAWTSASFYERIAGHAIDFYLLPPLGVAAFLGVVVYRRAAPGWLLAAAVATVVYFFLSGESGAHHYYYGVVAVPFCALAAAWTIARIPTRAMGLALSLLVCAIAAVHGFLRTRDWRPRPHALELATALRECLDEKVSAGERVTLYSHSDPTLFWFIDRKGWLAQEGEAPHGPAVIDRRHFDEASYSQQAKRLVAAGLGLLCENERAAAFAAPPMR